jgi:hypothetical protein
LDRSNRQLECQKSDVADQEEEEAEEKNKREAPTDTVVAGRAVGCSRGAEYPARDAVLELHMDVIHRDVHETRGHAGVSWGQASPHRCGLRCAPTKIELKRSFTISIRNGSNTNWYYNKKALSN